MSSGLADLEKTIASTVQSAIESQAKAKMIEALGGVDVMMDHFIKAMCTRKVKVDYREIPLLDHLLTKAVDEAIRTLVAELMVENEQQIKAEVVKRIKLDAKSVAEALVTHALPNQTYRINIQPVRND